MPNVSLSLAKGEGVMAEIRRIEDDGLRTHDDPRERTRRAPLEVLVIGVSRTGTICTSFPSPGLAGAIAQSR